MTILIIAAIVVAIIILAKLFRPSAANSKPMMCTDENTIKTITLYIVGKILSASYLENDRLLADDGRFWARDIVESALQKVTTGECVNYVQKGHFSVYIGQTLTSENRVFMDMFEQLIFGNYHPYENRAENMNQRDLLDIGLILQSVFRFFSSNDPSTRQEKAEGAKGYDEFFSP